VGLDDGLVEGEELGNLLGEVDGNELGEKLGLDEG